MTFDKRTEVIALIEKAVNYRYPLRWVDEKTSAGDFDGRCFAIDVFNIPASEQMDFLTKVAPVRKKIRELIGHRGIFIFHSPEATKRHYSHLFPVTEGITFKKDTPIKFPIPGPGGTDCKPMIGGASVRIDFGRAA